MEKSYTVVDYKIAWVAFSWRRMYKSRLDIPLIRSVRNEMHAHTRINRRGWKEKKKEREIPVT